MDRPDRRKAVSPGFARRLPVFCALLLAAVPRPAPAAQETAPAKPAPVVAPKPVASAPPSVAAPPASTPPAAPSASAGGLGNIGYLSATQLADRCSRTDAASSSYCFAYLAAVTDTARAYEIWLSSREFCLPTGIAQSDVRRAFMTYISAYPAQSAGQAASVVINALKQTYPCD